MDSLYHLLDLCDVPVLTALLLGLLTAVSPCPLATNLTAVAYIGRDISSRHAVFMRGLLYTLGRVLAYTVLGTCLIGMLRSGIDTFGLQQALSEWGTRLLPWVLLAVGLLMLLSERFTLPGLGNTPQVAAKRLHGAWGSLLLGAAFALAFCPTSALFYFGMLIPLAAAEAGGYALPALYALATALPAVAAAWLLAYSMGRVADFYRRMQLFQRWLNRAVGLTFVLVAVYYFFGM